MMAVLFAAMPMVAQTDGQDEEWQVDMRKNAFYFGPKAGVNFNTMTQPDEGKLFDKSDIGFSAGVALRARFGKATPDSQAGTGVFGVGVEAKYTQNKVKTVATDDEGNDNAALSVDYFEAPVYVQLYPLAKSNALNSLYVEVGAAFAGTLRRKPATLTVNDPNGQFSSVTYKLDTDGSKLKGMDIRPLVGVGYTVPGTGLDLNARYYLGTSKLADNFGCKLNRFEVSVAWLFKAVF